MGFFNSKRYTIEDFETSKVLEECKGKVDQLGDKKYSDVRDDYDNQYVNLVQEGGGVLGIALIGFTYILEYAGIRFWKLAGTSAGAINTTLLAVIGKKHEPKSKSILTHLINTNMFNFVDGHWIVRLGVKNVRLITFLAKFILALPIVIMFLVPIHFYSDQSWINTLVLILIVVFVLSLLFAQRLFILYKKRKFGLCRGWEFRKWISEILNQNNIKTIEDFINETTKSPKEIGLKYRHGSPNMGDSEVTLICCDVTSENKVEFPRDVDNYGIMKNIHPSIFVRASMSIPFFFEPAIISCTDEVVNKSNIFKSKSVKKDNYFVDGGLISNFPINVFHNPERDVCHLPVVGLNLDSGFKPKKDIFSSILSYTFKLVSTMRYYHDKNFLYQNRFYQDYCVHNIDVSKFNWLDFSMSDEQKLKLFEQGVIAGTKFLEDFNWREYKSARKELYVKTH